MIPSRTQATQGLATTTTSDQTTGSTDQQHQCRSWFWNGSDRASALHNVVPLVATSTHVGNTCRSGGECQVRRTNLCCIEVELTVQHKVTQSTRRDASARCNGWIKECPVVVQNIAIGVVECRIVDVSPTWQQRITARGVLDLKRYTRCDASVGAKDIKRQPRNGDGRLCGNPHKHGRTLSNLGRYIAASQRVGAAAAEDDVGLRRRYTDRSQQKQNGQNTCSHCAKLSFSEGVNRRAVDNDGSTQ